jgi:hypothetical protein
LARLLQVPRAGVAEERSRRRARQGTVRDDRVPRIVV